MDHSGHDMSSHSGHGEVMDHDGHHDMGTHNMGTHAAHMEGMGGDDNHTCVMNMMNMSFHFGYDEIILFDWWNINTVGGLIGSMIGIFVFATMYEGLKSGREELLRKHIAKTRYCGGLDKSNITTDRNSPIQFMEQIIIPPRTTMMSREHFLQTLLHMLQFVMSYLLMLIFMTYNVWLCVACLFGAGLGYFLFGWRKSVLIDISEHCH